MTSTTDVHASEARAERAAPRRTIRRDIEGLRALAVALVVVYHLWPTALPGGFVGVDVFLVVSGFLITSHLLEHPPRRPRDLAEFWGRRVRRLLPASFLVLAVTLVLSWRFAPVTQWAETSRQVLASTFYVENWALAERSVDYLAADAAASPVQHFWSLGVEEQFYLVWPVLVLVLAWGARRVARGPRVLGRFWVTAGMGVVVAASFAWSLYLTGADPSRAYFETPVRVWELGAGAILAGVAPRVARVFGDRARLRGVLAWAGLGAIVAGAFVLDGMVPFPGVAALLPVLGTVAVVGAHAAGPWSPHAALGARPVQRLGSVSYSVYLWHWPLIVLFPHVAGRERGVVGSLGVVLVTLVLASLTKHLVEDRLRGAHPLGVPLRRTYIFMGAGMLVLVALVAGVRFDLARTEAAAAERLAAAVDDADRCFGGAALVTEGCEPHGTELLLEPALAAEDQPAPYADDCWVLADFSEQKTCTYGSTAPDAREIALVGNSHAGHWLPALQVLAQEQNFRITTYLISQCFTVTVEIDFGDGRDASCLEWNERVLAETTDGRFDAVVASNRTARLLAGVPLADQADAARAAYTDTLERWAAAGVPVVVLRDTPYADVENVPDCVAAHLADLSACDGGRDREQADPFAEAARALDAPTVQVVDLTDRICRDDTCYSVVGGVIVYFDAGHLSATFARSLAPALREPVAAALRR